MPAIRCATRLWSQAAYHHTFLPFAGNLACPAADCLVASTPGGSACRPDAPAAAAVAALGQALRCAAFLIYTHDLHMCQTRRWPPASALAREWPLRQILGTLLPSRRSTVKDCKQRPLKILLSIGEKNRSRAAHAVASLFYLALPMNVRPCCT